MNHPVFIKGYASGPVLGSITTPWSDQWSFADHFKYLAGARAKTVAHAVGVSLDPELWDLPIGNAPNAVPDALTWWFDLHAMEYIK